MIMKENDVIVEKRNNIRTLHKGGLCTFIPFCIRRYWGGDKK